MRKIIVHYLSERSEGFIVFDGFSQTGGADDSAPNATGIRVKKILQEVEKASSILFHKLSGTSFY